MAGAWDFELGLELGTHEAIQRLVFHLHLMGLLEPLAQVFLGGKAVGLAYGLLKAGKHFWCE